MMQEEKIGRLIKRIDLTFAYEMMKTVKKYDLTSSQVEVLMYLGRNQDHEICQREIERFLHSSNPTVTGILKRLEKNGFIEREISTKDARYKHIIQSDKAKKIHREIKAALQNNEERLLSCLSDEERKELIYLLKKLIKNMN